MAHKAGCNADMPKGQVGAHGTRVNPNDFARNNMSKGGVNKMQPVAKTTAGTAKRK